MSEIVRLYAKIHGLVQGVSFRYYTLREAQGLQLKGYVRNCSDGTVEVLAEGDRDSASRLLSWLQHGPPHAQVKRVDYEWKEPQGRLRQFEVRF
jgi:acylphosphatase